MLLMSNADKTVWQLMHKT